MAVSLKKAKKDGGLYQRRPETEQLVNELEELLPDSLVQRCLNYDNPVSMEVMLYFLRRADGNLGLLNFEKLFKAFFSRLDVSLKKALPDRMFDRAADIRQEIMDRVAEMIAKDRNGYEMALDYYEVNFNSAFANLRKDTLRQIGPARENDPLVCSDPLTGVSDDRIEVLPEVEESVTELYELGLSKLDNPSFRSRLYAAIKDLPDDERRVVGLFLQGMQIEAKDSNKITISKVLKCTDRTVRNRLSRAYNSLQEVFLAEEEL